MAAIDRLERFMRQSCMRVADLFAFVDHDCSGSVDRRSWVTGTAAIVWVFPRGALFHFPCGGRRPPRQLLTCPAVLCCGQPLSELREALELMRMDAMDEEAFEALFRYLDTGGNGTIEATELEVLRAKAAAMTQTLPFFFLSGNACGSSAAPAVA